MCDTLLMSETSFLSDNEKLQLCISLLNEFGAQRMSQVGDEIHLSCCLPFNLHPHGDRNPSASLNWKKLLYNCFTCGGGSLLWWVAVCRGSSTHKATQWLGQHVTSDGLNLNDLLLYFDTIYSPHTDHKAPMPIYAKQILRPWMFLHPYLFETRGIPIDTLKHFSVGYDSKTERIIIPHFWHNDLVGWQSRRIFDDGTPKYKCSADFPRALTVFNHFDRVRGVDNISYNSELVVVESPMSVLIHHHHYPNIEATFGASVTAQQLRILSKHSRVHLFYDNDPAGWKATSQVAEYLIKYTDVRVVENPYNADAGDLSPQDFQALTKTAVPYSIWKPPRPNSLLDYVLC
jgi:Toprim-like